MTVKKIMVSFILLLCSFDCLCSRELKSYGTGVWYDYVYYDIEDFYNYMNEAIPYSTHCIISLEYWKREKNEAELYNTFYPYGVNCFRFCSGLKKLQAKFVCLPSGKDLDEFAGIPPRAYKVRVFVLPLEKDQMIKYWDSCLDDM